MAYSFVRKSKSNIQKENTYILYMIISSCFKKCILKNKLIENNLFLYYKEMPSNKQQKQETKIIELVERTIGDRLSDLKCEASITIMQNGSYRIYFKTYVEDIMAIIHENGRYEIKTINPLHKG